MYNFSFLTVYSALKLFLQFKGSLMYLIPVQTKKCRRCRVDYSYNII